MNLLFRFFCRSTYSECVKDMFWGRRVFHEFSAVTSAVIVAVFDIFSRTLLVNTVVIKINKNRNK